VGGAGSAAIGGGGHLEGGHKYAQLGDDAASSLYKSLIVQLKPDALHKALLVVDLNCHVGNFTRSFVDNWRTMQTPCFYLGMAADALETEFCLESVTESVKTFFLEGRFKYQGKETCAAEPPDNIVVAPPPKPTLKVLVLTEGTGSAMDGIAMPEHLVKTWLQHKDPELAALCKESLAGFDAELELGLLRTAVEPAPTPSKRPRTAEASSPGTPADPAALAVGHRFPQLKPMATLMDELLASCSMGKKNLELRIYAGNVIAIVNAGTEPASLEKGANIGMFGKGSFKEISEKETRTENDIAFCPEGGLTQVPRLLKPAF
jgi:hypothetical protein